MTAFNEENVYGKEGAENDILVSVICCTYNQEKYIGETLESFIMQKTDFAFEVLVNDDCSTDGTREIVLKYQSMYPDIIKATIQEKNLYSQGISPCDILIPKAKGEYLALCEGDDYWTDPLKLQKQIDALKKHPECEMCAHATTMVRANTKEFMRNIAPKDEDCILSMEEVIAGGGGFLSTNALVLRKSIMAEPVEFLKMADYDYCIQLAGALKGGIVYLKDNMAVYRRGADNSWTNYMYKNPDKLLEYLDLMKKVLKSLDQVTEGKYSDTIQQEMLKNEFSCANTLKDPKQVYSPKFRELRRQMSKKQTIITFLNCYMPWVLKLLNGKKQ